MRVTIRTSMLVVTAAAVAAASSSYAQNVDRCVGLEAITAKPRGNLPQSVLDRIRDIAKSIERRPPPTSLTCGLLAKTLDRLVNGKPIGGKRLDNDQPFDAVAAQAELDKALQQEAGLTEQLAEVQSTASDADERILLEAAVLQEHGAFNARDLRLQQLVQNSGG